MKYRGMGRKMQLVLPISKEDYDSKRYNYPRIEAERTRTAFDARRAERRGGEEDE